MAPWFLRRAFDITRYRSNQIAQAAFPDSLVRGVLVQSCLVERQARSITVSDETKTQRNEFQAQAQGKRTTLLQEFWDLLKHNKKWWLTPIILLILLLGLIVIGGGALPFIYTLF